MISMMWGKVAAEWRLRVLGDLFEGRIGVLVLMMV
jgi:hypothetical protein